MSHSWLSFTPAVIGTLAAFVLGTAEAVAQTARVPLETGWFLQSSAKIRINGDAISRPGFATAAWHRIAVPNTVVGALVESGVIREDLYFGMTLRKLPGVSYPIGERFQLLPMPADSPYKPSWWYRTEFDLPRQPGRERTALHFNGINYRANIWLNGRRIARATDVAGAFRRYEFDVTNVIRAGARNALAVEVFAPEPHDLAFMWVDWNPTPPDKNMGLWSDVFLTRSGPVVLRHPYVQSKLDVPSLQSAALTVIADVSNPTDRPVKATVRGTIDLIRFAKDVTLAPKQRTTVRFTPNEMKDLTISNPRVWWPYRHGAQHLYTLAIEVLVDGVVSDADEVTFGIQQMTSELTKEGHRLFRVNGKPILIRGGGWASDMLLRPPNTERLEAEFRYVKEMGLNTIRLEGKLETDEFYDLADRHGILLMPGWCCCDQWEMWDKWDAEDHRVAPASLKSQALRLRNHPSVLVWLNGSDAPPPPDVEGRYLQVLEQCEWPKPVLSSAHHTPAKLSGPSGVKMKGPWDYVPPWYWLTDKEKGGAFGFATEIGPGGAVPPIESLRQMLPEDHLWPIDAYWNFHAGGDEFKDLSRFTETLEGRYGKATGVLDYARKAQALTYESERAMFEGYARNKYLSTGVIQWMLNNAWPSMIWHLYDYFLRPGGGYFGTKKANEPVHVQYSYDDNSIAVVNDLYEPFKGLTVTAELFDVALVKKFSGKAVIDLPADAVVRALAIPPISDLTTTYFLRLLLTDAAGSEVSRNFYWLSTKQDVLDWNSKKWFHTPTLEHADLTALAKLPPTTLRVSARFETDKTEGRGRISVSNIGSALAFQVRLKVIDPSDGREILPVYWQDNYFELFPGETREIRVSYPGPRGAPGVEPRVEVEAWNVSS
jgi:exo-1,4-beta-D-glucosaminidase